MLRRRLAAALGILLALGRRFGLALGDLAGALGLEVLGGRGGDDVDDEQSRDRTPG